MGQRLLHLCETKIASGMGGMVFLLLGERLLPLYVHLILQIFRLVARQSNRTWNLIGPKRLLIALKIENNILKIRFFFDV